MANRERQIRIYDLHSWTGIALGLFLYVVCFTGSVAMFARDEIKSWEDPALRLTVAETPVAINETFSSWVEEHSDGYELTFLGFNFPTAHQPFYSAQLNRRPEDGGDIDFVTGRWDTEAGEPIVAKGSGLSTWLLDFHRDLMWPDELGGRQIGRGLVGLAGVVLLLSIISGVVAHTKIVQELYSLRYWRSVRLKWQDTHKVIGLWTLPFSSMIAVTGAYLGVITLLLPIVAMIMFKGDIEGMIEELGFGQADPVGEKAQMLSIDEIAEMQHPDSGELPAHVYMRHYGDQGAVFEVIYESKDDLKNGDVVTLSGVTGEEVEGSVINQPSPANRTLRAMSPLHYGTYGAIALKLMYFVLGLMLSAIVALGTMMWIERRLHGNEGNKSEAFYRRLSHLNVGVTLGLPAATAVLFYADKLAFHGPGSHVIMSGWIYLGTVAAAIGYAFWRQNDYRATVELLLGVGAMLVVLPLVNTVATGDLFITKLFAKNQDWAWLDLAFLLVGSAVLVAATKLPQRRPDAKKKKRTAVPAAAVPAE
ncbi:MAG: PepSY-associated TM helix domain-containing protein [Pseudomonadota bacterium]